MFALLIFPGSRPPSIVDVCELNFCVRDGREPERRLWRMQKGRSECSGRQMTKAFTPRNMPGTASGNRWTQKICLHISVEALMLALSIFPGSHPPSIVDVCELNFCVRDGNRWTLATINTNLLTLVTHTGFEPMLTA